MYMKNVHSFMHDQWDCECPYVSKHYFTTSRFRLLYLEFWTDTTLIKLYVPDLVFAFEHRCVLMYQVLQDSRVIMNLCHPLRRR
jgi:hypothetical protein